MYQQIQYQHILRYHNPTDKSCRNATCVTLVDLLGIDKKSTPEAEILLKHGGLRVSHRSTLVVAIVDKPN